MECIFAKFPNVEAAVAFIDRDFSMKWIEALPIRIVEKVQSLVGNTCYKAFCNRDQPCDDCRVVDLMKTGEHFRIEVSDNNDSFFSFKGFPVRAGNNELSGVTLLMRRVNHEEFAPDFNSLRLFASLFDRSPTPMIVLDSQSLQPLHFNAAVLNLLGYSRSEFAKMSLPLLDMTNYPHIIKQQVKQTLEKGQTEYTTVLSTKDRRLKDCQIVLKTIAFDDKAYIFAVIHDITNNRIYENKLAKSESRYRFLVENSPDVILEIDLQGTILYSNRVLTGTKREDAVGTNLMDYIPGSQHNRARKFIQRAILRKKNSAFELSVITPRGIRWWSTRVLPIKEHGTINRFLLIINDITGSKRAEEALKLSEERYRMLVENAPLPIVIHRDERVIYINSIAVKMIGVTTKEELLGKSILDFIHPDDHPMIMDLVAVGYRKPYQPMYSEFRVITPAGELHYVTASSMTIIYQDELSRLVIINDVTEQRKTNDALKESEKRFRYLADNMRDAVWIMDLNFKHKYISPSIQNIRGYTPEEIFDLPIEKSLPPYWLENAKNLLEWGLESSGLDDQGRPLVITFEQEENCKDGSTVWTEVQAHFIFDDTNKPTGIMGITRDITERKQAQKTIEQLEKQFRYIIGKTHNPTAVIKDGKFVFLNQAGMNLFAATDLHSIIGRTILDLIDDNYHAIWQNEALQSDSVSFLPKEIKLCINDLNGNKLEVTAEVSKIQYAGESAILVVFN